MAQSRKRPQYGKSLGAPASREDDKFLNPEIGNAKHPFNNEKNQAALVTYITDRLDFANVIRKPLVDRFAVIDIEYSGFIKQDKDDQRREMDNQRGDPKATKVNLELVKTQIDEATTYLMSVFAPDEGMFEAIASQPKQKIANAFALKLNRDALRKQYYRHYEKAFKSMLKYNFGGWIAYWEEQTGVKLENAPGGAVKKTKDKVVWRGNRIQSIDPYNFLWDVAVHPSDVAEYGEFFAIVEMHRKFRVQKMEEDGVIFGTKRFVGKDIEAKYFIGPPTVRTDKTNASVQTHTSVDWNSWLSAGQVKEVSRGIESVTYYGWICPDDFGLSDVDSMEIWKIVIMGNKYVVAANRLENAHGLLPAGIAVPNEDELGLQTKSHAETLIPGQRFGSHLMNTHIEASRKALYGFTVYDGLAIDFGQMQTEVAPKIAVKPGALANRKIGDILYQSFDGPKTDGTMQDLQFLFTFMQKLLPTDILKQVTDLDRATTYQAAAVVAGANRRMNKIAKIIDSQAMKTVRFMLMYNLLEKGEPLTMIDETGNEVQFDPAEARGADIEYAIMEGLKGIDKLQIISAFKEVVTIIIQNQQALQDFDIVELVNYWTSLSGDKTDMTQFRRKDGLGALPPEVKQILTQALQSGQLNGIIKQGMDQIAQARQQAAGGQTVPLQAAG